MTCAINRNNLLGHEGTTTFGQLEDFIADNSKETLVIHTEDCSSYKEGTFAQYIIAKASEKLFYRIIDDKGRTLESDTEIMGDLTDLDNLDYEIGMCHMCSLQHVDGFASSAIKSLDTYEEMTAKGYRHLYSHRDDRYVWVDMSKPVPSWIEF